ncbi:hypothetical protein CYMTET_53247, partial [Cymbomonas tetramitiformis]
MSRPEFKYSAEFVKKLDGMDSSQMWTAKLKFHSILDPAEPASPAAEGSKSPSLTRPSSLSSFPPADSPQIFSAPSSPMASRQWQKQFEMKHMVKNMVKWEVTCASMEGLPTPTRTPPESPPSRPTSSASAVHSVVRKSTIMLNLPPRPHTTDPQMETGIAMDDFSMEAENSERSIASIPFEPTEPAMTRGEPQHYPAWTHHVRCRPSRASDLFQGITGSDSRDAGQLVLADFAGNFYVTLVIGPCNFYVTLFIGPCNSYVTLVIGPCNFYVTLVIGPYNFYMILVIGPCNSYVTLVIGPCNSQAEGPSRFCMRSSSAFVGKAPLESAEHKSWYFAPHFLYTESAQHKS